jgi:hypothetical protein
MRILAGMDINRLPETVFVLAESYGSEGEKVLAVVLTSDDAAALQAVYPDSATIKVHEIPLVLLARRLPKPIGGAVRRDSGGVANVTIFEGPPPDQGMAPAVLAEAVEAQRREQAIRRG